MTNWYYHNKNGEKIAVTSKQLQALAQHGIITPETIIETEEGKTAPASKVKGLTFAEAKPSQAPQPKPAVPPIKATPAQPVNENLIDIEHAPKKKFQMPKMTVGRIIGIASGVLVLFIIIGIASSGGGSGGHRKAVDDYEQSLSTTVPANMLTIAYNSNKVTADNDYKGKAILVYGKVDSVGKDIRNKAFVAFASPKGTLFTVQCFFDKGRESELENMRKGDYVAIVGYCKGATGNVILDNCKFHSKSPTNSSYWMP